MTETFKNKLRKLRNELGANPLPLIGIKSVMDITDEQKVLDDLEKHMADIKAKIEAQKTADEKQYEKDAEEKRKKREAERKQTAIDAEERRKKREAEWEAGRPEREAKAKADYIKSLADDFDAWLADDALWDRFDRNKLFMAEIDLLREEKGHSPMPWKSLFDEKHHVTFGKDMGWEVFAAIVKAAAARDKIDFKKSFEKWDDIKGVIFGYGITNKEAGIVITPKTSCNTSAVWNDMTGLKKKLTWVEYGMRVYEGGMIYNPNGLDL